MFKEKWLNLFLHFSGYIFSLKEKIVKAKSWTQALPHVILLLLAEVAFLLVSLPLYLMVSPKKVQESGFVFPKKDKEPIHLHIYVVRRKITLATICTAGGIFLLKVVFIGVVSTYLLGAQTLLAATQNWDFNTPADYAYTAGKIIVANGVAQLVDQGGGGSCSGTATVCNTFGASPTCTAQAGCSWGGGASGSSPAWSTTWGSYSDWESGSSVSGSSPTTGGNPTNYKDIVITRNSQAQTASGYWQQSFTTTVANPATATINFDWSIKSYNGTYLTSYIIYVFVDNASGAPIIGNQVWSQTITGTTNWATVSNLNVASKLTTAGTYYIKLLARRIKPSGNPPNTNNTVGWDNVSLNWAKNNTCSGTATACNTFSTSTTCTAQGGCSWNTVLVYPTTSPAIYPNTSLSPAGVTSWNAFSETATKGAGEIYYQLSNNDGATWKYWNNSAWATSTLASHYNTASVVSANISTFSAVSGKIKWKAFLSSNGSGQVILDNVEIGYVQNNPPDISNLSASQDTTSGYVKVNYTLTDLQSDPSNLVAYEYSLTGAFTGEQSIMTASSSDPLHSGVSGLSTSPSGVPHIFVWNAMADLGSVYSGTIYVRLRANDGIADGANAVSSVFPVDYLSPVISNVIVQQSSTSSDINIGYSLFDNTSDNILVELRISSDGGGTWNVATTSTSGDVGAMVWHSGTDFANQENDNMLISLRAKDKYQNQGSYIDSSSFVLDNRAPAVAVPVDLLAQPLAGATTVLVGGSFAENNPDTNNFYMAINGNSYGSAQVGDANTATPTDKSVDVGATLKGNDYISSVKIEHIDDFGQMTANENNSPNSNYKYVRPYTPPAPTISNPGEGSLDVTINKHSDEVDGLEYAIFENTQSLYVQSDGSLGSGAYWQAASAITVTGLSQPISQYSFQVKSRNTSDVSHSLSSESDFSSGASSDYQSPQITINSTAQTTDGTKYVVIDYTANDYQGQANNLVKYEYSLNGTSWQTMIEKSGVGSDGISSLPFTSGGVNLKFSWDVGLDLPNVEDSSVYIRLQSNDSITNSNIAVSPAFIINTAGPVVSNIQVSQEPATDNVMVSYDLADGAGANNWVVLLISDDSGSTYNVLAPSKSGDVGSGITAGLARSIVWDAGLDTPNQEKSSMKVKITATDSYGNEGSPLESSDFVIDTKAPLVSNVLAVQTAGSALVAVSYDLVDFSTSTIEFNVSLDSGTTWTVSTTTYTTGLGLFNWNAGVDFPDQELGTMRIRVRAIDNFGHHGLYEESADFSLNTKILSISNIIVQQNAGENIVAIHYDINKNATTSLEISADGGTTWTVPVTTLTGNVNALVVKGNNKTISWNPGIDFSNEEKTTMRVRFNTYYESADFVVDTASPLGLLSLSKSADTTTTATINWSFGIVDAHFSYYELWHGSNRNDVINRAGTALKWGPSNDANLSNINTISTVITGLNLTANYYVKIWAIDEYGNESTVADLNVYSAPVVVPPEVVPLETRHVGGGGNTLSINTIETPVKVLEAPIVLSPQNNSNIVDRTPTLVGVTTPFAQIEITLDEKNIFTTTANNDGAWQFKLPTDFALADGVHNFVLKVVDLVGDKSPETTLVLNKIVLPAEVTLTPEVIPTSPVAVATLPSLLPAELVRENIVAVELPGVPIPEVTNVNISNANNIFTFSGKALPGQEVLVYIHSDQALIYRAKADANGVWQINHSQADVELSPGEHTIFAVAVDPTAKVKSQPSSVSTFTVSKNFWVSLFERLNLQTTAVTLAIILLSMLWLYRIKKRAVANA